MTLVVALARPTFGFLWADTRRSSHVNGDPEAAKLGFHDDFMKVAPTETGWAASAPSVYWHEKVMAALEHSDGDIDALLRAAAPGTMAELEAVSSAHASMVRAQQHTFVLTVEPTGCSRLILDWRGHEVSGPAPEAPAFTLPHDGNPTVIRRLLEAHDGACSGASLDDALRATEALHVAIYRHLGFTGSVSPRAFIGILFRDGQRHLSRREVPLEWTEDGGAPEIRRRLTGRR